MTTSSSPLAQIFDVGAVHVHDREALAPLLLRPGLVDEHDAGVEKALLAGDAREHRVGDHVRDAARVRGVGRVLLARDLLAARGVPQAELRGDAPAVLLQHAAGQHELRVDRLPGVDVGRGVRIGDRLGKARRIDRQKEDRTSEIVADDAADLVARLFAGERRDGDRHGFEIRAGVDIDVARRRARRRAGESRGGRARSAASAERRETNTNGVHWAISRDNNDGAPSCVIGRRPAD